MTGGAAAEPLFISVLIPAFNEEQLIARVIGAVRESFAGVGHEAYEIIVCDNNSTDGTKDIASSLGAEVVHEPHNQISKARNTAAGRARGEWLIFLDADTFLSRELLAATMECLASGKVCGGGSTLEFDRADIGFSARCLTAFWNRVSTTFALAAGSYIFCRRAAWADVGGFDERVYAGEELFFSRKIRLWGRKRGSRFRVLTKTPIRTSARKMEWYGQWQLLWRVILMARPGAMKSREMCGLWYQRPDPKRPS